MTKKLVLVESPNKCSTIEKMLGGKYKVLASCGHICDLDNKNYVDIENDFKPKYVVVKKDVLRRIKDAVKHCDEVIIGTDLDREGEAIGYHLLRELKLPLTTKRIIFNEITKPALKKAIDNPTTLNTNIFNAYQARIILDKLLGFSISPVLWAYIKDRTSAGRCQSPTLSLVLDREQEIEEFSQDKYYTVDTEFVLSKNNYVTGRLSQKLKTKEEIDQIITVLTVCVGKIINIETSIKKISPSPPYITSTIQQDASRSLNLSPQNCNNILKQLYENAKITYPRTDLDELSEEAKQNSRDLISQRFGKEYLSNAKKRKKKKNDNAQEAHEAIRPVDITQENIDDLGPLEQKLYHMIWKRTIQSQMAQRQNENLSIKIQLCRESKSYDYFYDISYVSCKFDGFTILNAGDKSNIDIESIKKSFKIGNSLEIEKTEFLEQFTKPKSRLTQADLIKLIEKLGIGRPSTFASILMTLINRNYIEIKNTEPKEITSEKIVLHCNNISLSSSKKTIPMEKQRVFITDLGKSICEFLKEKFPIIMNYGYTGEVNKKLDIISEGSLLWHSVVRQQYDIFSPIVDNLIATKPSLNTNGELLGEIDGIKYYKYKGKYGWTVKWNRTSKTEYIAIPDNLAKNIANVKLEDIEGIIPKYLGKYKNSEVKIKTGKFGPYISWNKINKSIKNTNIDLEKAIKIITEKKTTKSNSKVLKEIKQYKIINGQYGLFITNGKKNKKVPNNKDFNDINLSFCSALFKN